MTALGDVLHLLFTANLWQATLAAAVLLLLPALGGVISERSGVVNIAMEGMMLTGAFFGVAADLAWHNVWLATGVAILAGGLMAVIHAVVSIQFRADQIVSGIAINIFAAGLTVFLVNRIYGLQDIGHIGPTEGLPYIGIPGLDQIPFFGKVVFDQNVIVYAALGEHGRAIDDVLAGGAPMHIARGFRRGLGNFCGERLHQRNGEIAGMGGSLGQGIEIDQSGLAGAFLAIGISNTFGPNMTDGRGYIALAAMIFGKWTPFGAFIACLIFGLGEAIYANNSTIHISQYFLSMLPYVITLVVLAGLVGRSTPPASDGLPYVPGSE